ncbi:hypothetical protein HDU67_007432 [Dinochytrium kinnereticum]|nr:hypothetical protein HDU67_007432 [Dinochytrium kinnereticum]
MYMKECLKAIDTLEKIRPTLTKKFEKQALHEKEIARAASLREKLDSTSKTLPPGVEGGKSGVRVPSQHGEWWRTQGMQAQTPAAKLGTDTHRVAETQAYPIIPHTTGIESLTHPYLRHKKP